MRNCRFLFCLLAILPLSAQAADNADDIKLPDINLTETALSLENSGQRYTSPQGLVYASSTKKHGVKKRVSHILLHNTLNPGDLSLGKIEKNKLQKTLNNSTYTSSVFSNPATNRLIHPDVVSLADQVYAQLKTIAPDGIFERARIGDDVQEVGNVNINGIDYKVNVICAESNNYKYTFTPVNDNEFITGYSITNNLEVLDKPLYGYAMYIWDGRPSFGCCVNTFFPC